MQCGSPRPGPPPYNTLSTARALFGGMTRFERRRPKDRIQCCVSGMELPGAALAMKPNPGWHAAGWSAPGLKVQAVQGCHFVEVARLQSSKASPHAK